LNDDVQIEGTFHWGTVYKRRKEITIQNTVKAVLILLALIMRENQNQIR